MRTLIASFFVMVVLTTASFAHGFTYREAVIHSCSAMALAQYHYKGGDDDRERARNARYADCMFTHRQAP